MTPDDRPIIAMNPFTKVPSLLQFEDNSRTPRIYCTDVYVDSSDLGSMLTIPALVYDYNYRQLLAIFKVVTILSDEVTRTRLSLSDA